MRSARKQQTLQAWIVLRLLYIPIVDENNSNASASSAAAQYGRGTGGIHASLYAVQLSKLMEAADNRVRKWWGRLI